MNFALRIPDYYKKDIELLKGEVSINQFIVNAVAEKIASLKTLDYLEERAQRGSREHALNILGNAPDIEPDKRDDLGTATK
jgi:hypothetical protein